MMQFISFDTGVT